MTSLEDAPIVFFADFDGTITLDDTGVILIDNGGLGTAGRRALEAEVFHGRMTYRAAIERMWAAVRLTSAGADAMLADVRLDPGFAHFTARLAAARLPLTVLSAGLDPVCRQFLAPFMQDGDAGGPIVDVRANDIVRDPATGWRIRFRDDTVHGHDKGAPLRALRTARGERRPPRPLIVFVGDGLSDLSAAKEADVLFARAGKDLEAWCAKEGVAHTAFNSFDEITDWLEVALRDI
ncbi:hypothetical protein HK405_013614 [Cladochytrium tenue]|nr:hypothetical protein HK405_013614 [Cladochytrium tenue]